MRTNAAAASAIPASRGHCGGRVATARTRRRTAGSGVESGGGAAEHGLLPARAGVLVECRGGIAERAERGVDLIGADPPLATAALELPEDVVSRDGHQPGRIAPAGRVELGRLTPHTDE